MSAELDRIVMRLARALGRAPAGWRSDEGIGDEARRLYATLSETVAKPRASRRRGVPTDVYVCRSAAGEVLYVGLSLSVAERLGQHRAGGFWWGDVASIDIEKCDSRDAASVRERDLIAALRPLHNRNEDGA